MNFTQFTTGVPMTAAIPVSAQFAASKLNQGVATANGQVIGVLHGGENGVHYIRPLDPAAFTTSTTQSNGQPQIITLPITMPGAKPGDPQQTIQIQVMNPLPAVSVPQATPSQSPKYHISQVPVQTFGQGATVLTVAYNNQEGLQLMDGSNGLPEGMTVVAAIQPQDIHLINPPSTDCDKPEKEMVPMPITLIKNEVCVNEDTGSDVGSSAINAANFIQNSMQEYLLQRIQQSTSALPVSLHQYLKFNNDSVIKREQITEDGVIETIVETAEPPDGLIMNDYENELANTANPDDKGKKKKKYKKKPPKPKKPKPGQVHIATALDGTTLFCCPECHMAYPEKELLEQHLVGHKIERRFICDICGAGLKRKEHLERHKLGHNPERPFVCSVCMKGFKRKEHLNLHFVIHSGQKTEICIECGKGFYRKDHLRKHARSHITRRAKELQNQSLISKDGTAQLTIQVNVPSSQLQIPVQIQVPQHHIQVNHSTEDDDNQVSTVVLPAASEGVTILPH